MGVEGIILAAGLSSRFPSYKLIQEYDGQAIIKRCVENMLPFVERIIVVTGHNASLIEEALNGYSQVRLVHNDHFKDGMFSSIKVGLKHVTSNRVFIIPGDHPITKATTYQGLLDAKGDVIIPSFQNRGGHPILMSQRLIDNVLTTKAEHLRAFLKDIPKTYVVVDDPHIRTDIDTEASLDALRRGIE